MKVTFSRQALRDVDGILDHYLRTGAPRAADLFLADLDQLRVLLVGSPKAGRSTRRADTRVLLLSRFPYHVFHKRVGASELRIIRVRHAHRRPLAGS